MKSWLEKKLKIKSHLFKVFRFNKKTRKGKLLGTIMACNCPDAVIRGWKKFKVPKTNEEQSLIYARRVIIK